VNSWGEIRKDLEYAVLDAQIVVKHVSAKEKFNRGQQEIGVPLTLASMARKYVANEWTKNFDKHLPYKIYGEYLLGNAYEI
jgi:hypothetical protein